MPLGENNLSQMAVAVHSYVARLVPQFLNSFSVAQAFTPGDERRLSFKSPINGALVSRLILTQA